MSINQFLQTKMLPEKDYDSMQETLYLFSIPGMEKSILEAQKEPLEEGINYIDVKW